MSDFIEIYTDGACQGNPGKGGWGAILLYGTHKKEISGYIPHTTNNQMELMAVIESLKIVKKEIKITIHTDSTYVQKGITEWIFNWKKNGWKTAKKQPVKNYEFWQELDSLAKQHQITWKWVKGHSGNKYNDIADKLAVDAIK
ncbi:MAG: ribonuclease HI [Granulosicoccus sp.]|jgi:ribonuclease HI